MYTICMGTICLLLADWTTQHCKTRVSIVEGEPVVCEKEDDGVGLSASIQIDQEPSGIWIDRPANCYTRKRNGERSQAVKAVDCGSTTRGFESRRSPSSSLITSGEVARSRLTEPMFLLSLFNRREIIVSLRIQPGIVFGHFD